MRALRAGGGGGGGGGEKTKSRKRRGTPHMRRLRRRRSLTFGVPRERRAAAASRGAWSGVCDGGGDERLNAPCVARRRDAFRNVVRTSPLLASLPFAEQRAAAELLAELGDARRRRGETVVAQDGEPRGACFSSPREPRTRASPCRNSSGRFSSDQEPRGARLATSSFFSKKNATRRAT